MKATIICNIKTKARIISDLYFRNYLANFVHVNVDKGLTDRDFRVIMYIPYEFMPRELLTWISEQPNAVKVLTRS